MQTVEASKNVKRLIKADRGRLSSIIEYESGARVEIPINNDGSVRWFDDEKLKKGGADNDR